MAADDDHSPGTREPRHRLRQRFEVIRKLGHGTYGKVQLAVNKETGQEVAIKTIKKAKIENGQDLIRIRREIQIMSYVQHPHIIHIHEVFENKEKIVLVMQYASGGELYDYLKTRRGASEADSRRIFRQIVSAVYYCHKNKICHRDLKLENILLDERGNAKIADFGLSNVFSDDKFLHTFCGSPLYASPEIVKGKPYYGPEVDCWSLGVLLYTLIYGAMPFDGSNFRSLVRQISEGDYYEPKRKSDASGLIQHLLTVKPAKRATVADICDHWWVNLGYEHPLSQVAEDMANFSPINVDAFLNLPQTSRNEQCKSPRIQDSRSTDSPTPAQQCLSQESNECKATKLVSKCHLNDTNYDAINSDSISCSDDSLITNNIDPSKDTSIESNIFPSDCFHLVPDKKAVSRFSVKPSNKELSKNNQDNIKYIPKSEISALSSKLSVAEHMPNMKNTTVSVENSHSPEVLNKFTMNKNEVIHDEKQSTRYITSNQDSYGKEKPLEKNEITGATEKKAETLVQLNSSEKFNLQLQSRKETFEKKSPVTSYDKCNNQKNVQDIEKTSHSTDISLSCSENSSTPQILQDMPSTSKVSYNSISIQEGNIKSDEESLIHQSVINNEAKAGNKVVESNEKYINQRNKQNSEKAILPKDNSLSLSENNEPSETLQNNSNMLIVAGNSVSAYANKSISDEEKLIKQSMTKSENKTESKTNEKTKDLQDGKKSQMKRGPGKLVIPKFFEAAQATEKSVDNKKMNKALWSVLDTKKTFENKSPEKKPIYIPTRRVSDARSKFEQKIESQVSTLPRRTSRHSGTLKQDLSTCSLSSLKNDQKQGDDVDASSLKDVSCILKPCEKSTVMQIQNTPGKEARAEIDFSDNDQAKKTSVKPDISEINNVEGNKVTTDNPNKNMSTVSPLYEEKASRSQNKTDISEKQDLETITKVSSTSVDLESAPITQNRNSAITSSEQNSSVEETKHMAYQSKKIIDAWEEQQQHKCNFHEGTTSAFQTFLCDSKETCKENENVQKNLSEFDQEVKIAKSDSITDKKNSSALNEEKIISDDCHKEQAEENKINNLQTLSNDSGNCSDNEIHPSSKAQPINDQSSGYISENQSLIGSEEQDTNEGTKLDLLKTFMEQECFPLNALLQNGYDHSHDMSHPAHQKPSFTNTTSINNDIRLGINSLPVQNRKVHQSRRRHSDAPSFLQPSDNQSTYGLRDISDLPESCYDDMLRFLNSRDTIRSKCPASSVLSKHRHSRHTANKDHQTRIQHWIKSEQRNGHSTDKDSSDNDDDFDIHLDYSYPVASASNTYQNINTIEDTLAPIQYTTQFPIASRSINHTGYRIADEFTSAGNYKCNSLSNEETENIIGIPNRNINYIRRQSHTMRYKDPFLTDVSTRYIQNPVFQPLFPGYHHSNTILREQLKTRPNVAELYGTLRRRSCKSDGLDFPEQRDGFYSSSLVRKSLHTKQNISFGKDLSDTERIRRNYARSLSLDIPDLSHHPARTNHETNLQMHIPQNYTIDPVQAKNSINLHLEDRPDDDKATINYPACVNTNSSQKYHNTNSEPNQQFNGEMKISEDIMQCEINKVKPDIKYSSNTRKLSDCVESMFKSEHSLLQHDVITKPDENIGSVSDQDLSTDSRKHESATLLSPTQTKPIAHKTSSLSLLEALKMQGYKNVIAQNLNFGSSLTESSNFERFRSTDEQEGLKNFHNCKEQENVMEQENINGGTILSNECPNLFPVNYECPQYDNLTFQQSNSKQQLATVRESNESLSSKFESDQEESVSERIWRKSFYSRFNDSYSKRRKSYRDGDLKAQSISGSSWDILMDDSFKDDVLSRRRSSLTLGNSYSSTLPRSGIKPITKQRSCGSEVADPLLEINDSSMIHRSSYRQKCKKNNRSSSLEENISEDSSSFPVQRPTHSIAADRDLLYTTTIAESPYNRLYGTLKSPAYCNNSRQMASQIREGDDSRSGANLGGILPRRRYSTFDGYLYVQKTPTLAESVTSILDSTNIGNDEFS